MVQINDVTLRDGHQSLLSGRLRQEHIDQLAPILDQAGFDRCEVWGGTTYEIPVTFKGEDPWENLDKIRAAMPSTKLSMLVRGQSLVSRTIQSDETVKLFIAKAAKHGMNIFRVFDALNDFDNVKPVLDAVQAAKEAGHDVQAEGTISYTDPVTLPDGRVIHSLDDMVALAHRFVEEGHADTICIKDMAGLLTAETATALVTRLKAELPNTPLVLHSHATMGRSDEAIKAAIKAGVDQVDTASAGLAYGSGQSATEDILAWLKKHHPEKAPQLNEEKLKELNDALVKIRPHYAAFEAKRYAPAIEKLLMEAQVPGGMVTTMASNIKQLLGASGANLYDRVFATALEEMVQVRADAGYPPLVTPTSQVVMTQAVFNACAMVRAQDRGEDPQEHRYTSLTNDFANLVQGRFGKLPVAASVALQAMASKQGIAPLDARKRPADDVAVDMNAQRIKVAATLQMPTEALTDEDLLTSILSGKAGMEFLAHKHNVTRKTFETLPDLPALPEHLNMYGKPNTASIAPLVFPYADALVHGAIEQARTAEGSDLGEQLAHRATLLKQDMFTVLTTQGGYDARHAFAIEKEVNRLLAERSQYFGLPASAAPTLTREEIKASAMGQSAGMANRAA